MEIMDRLMSTVIPAAFTFRFAVAALRIDAVPRRSKRPLKLTDDKSELICKADGMAFPVRDGIPVMLVDEAETVDDVEHGRLVALAESEGIRPTFGD